MTIRSQTLRHDCPFDIHTSRSTPWTSLDTVTLVERTINSYYAPVKVSTSPSFCKQGILTSTYSMMCIAGDIHVWDRESGSLLHHIRSQALGGDLTCIAWNPVADPFIFATGSHDGGVRIWTHPKSDPTITGDGTYSPRSSRPVSGAATPRESDEMSIMPGFQLDVDYRTESPTTQQDFDLARSSEDSAVPPSLTRRTIAFTAPEVLKNS